MYDILWYNAHIVLEDSLLPNGFIAAKNGSIAYIGHTHPAEPAQKEINVNGHYLSPGFIDTHSHGGGGCDFMDGTADAFITAAQMHLKHGTTTLCPTSLTSTDADLFTFLDCFLRAKETNQPMPKLPGVHLEGPYFSPDEAGAQPPALMQQPDPAHYLRILDYAKGNIRRWSCAPELPGALELGAELARRGIIASIAHTNATLQQVETAMRHGFTHLTHFYSGMSTIRREHGKRILGVVEAGYLFDDLTLEIIADGMHLPPPLLQMILKCKSAEKISLVTDSMRGAGMPDGPSVLGGLSNGVPVILEEGVAKLPSREAFAGSIATTDRLVRVMVKQAGMSLPEAVRLMTFNPAKLLGLHHCTGSLAVGKAADFVIFDDEITVQSVYINGNKMK